MGGFLFWVATGNRGQVPKLEDSLNDKTAPRGGFVI